MDQQDPTRTGRSSARFDDLVTDHAPRVLRLARRLTGNRADADDLTQEVFLRAFRALDRADPDGPCRLAAPDHGQRPCRPRPSPRPQPRSS